MLLSVVIDCVRQQTSQKRSTKRIKQTKEWKWNANITYWYGKKESVKIPAGQNTHLPLQVIAYSQGKGHMAVIKLIHNHWKTIARVCSTFHENPYHVVVWLLVLSGAVYCILFMFSLASFLSCLMPSLFMSCLCSDVLFFVFILCASIHSFSLHVNLDSFSRVFNRVAKICSWLYSFCGSWRYVPTA